VLNVGLAWFFLILKQMIHVYSPILRGEAIDVLASSIQNGTIPAASHDSVLAEEVMTQYMWSFGAFAATLAAQRAIVEIRYVFAMRARALAEAQMGREAIAHVFAANLDWFAGHPPAEIGITVTKALPAGYKLVDSALWTITPSVVAALGTGYAIWVAYGVPEAVVSIVVGCGVNTAIMYFGGIAERKLKSSWMTKTVKQTALIEDAVSSVHSVKGMGSEAQVGQELRRVMQEQIISKSTAWSVA